MTQKTLPNKFHPAINLYRLSVKRTAGLTVLITVFSLRMKTMARIRIKKECMVISILTATIWITLAISLVTSSVQR